MISLTKRIKNRLDLMRSISRKHIMNCDIIKDNVLFGRVYHPKGYDYIHGVMIRDNFSYGNKDWTVGDNLANEEKKIVLFTFPNYAKCYTNGEKQTLMVDTMKVLAILVCK